MRKRKGRKIGRSRRWSVKGSAKPGMDWVV